MVINISRSDAPFRQFGKSPVARLDKQK